MPKKKKILPIYSPSGFTLIELLVVLGITVILLGIAVPVFNSFTKKQLLKTEAEKMVSRLQLAQSKGRNNDQESGEVAGTKILGYLVDFTTTGSNQKYYLRKHRTISSHPSEYQHLVVIDEYVLPEEISLSFASPAGVQTGFRVFYYNNLKATFRCASTLPDTETIPDYCANLVIITLTDGVNEHYVYIEPGGVIYENNS